MSREQIKSDAGLESLFGALEQRDYPENAVIYHAGKSCEALYEIFQGLVKLVHYLPNGAVRTVRLLRRHDTFGLEALVDEHYHHTAIALQETRLRLIPLDRMQSLRQSYPEFSQQLMLDWQKSLDEADRFITEFSTGSAESRLARLLLFLAEPSQGCCFNKIGRLDIASILGVTTETSSRLMADFRRRGVIDCMPGRCNCNPQQLRVIAEDF